MGTAAFQQAALRASGALHSLLVFYCYTLFTFSPAVDTAFEHIANQCGCCRASCLGLMANLPALASNLDRHPEALPRELDDNDLSLCAAACGVPGAARTKGDQAALAATTSAAHKIDPGTQ
eukprot:2609903-Pleurochrysis_carterae.AAC.1